MQVMLFTLVTGTQILGKVSPETLASINAGTTAVVDITTALEIRLAEGPQGIQLGLVPYGFPIVQNDPKRNFTTRFFLHALVTLPQEPPKQLIDAYTQMTSSIQLASNIPQMSVVK